MSSLRRSGCVWLVIRAVSDPTLNAPRSSEAPEPHRPAPWLGLIGGSGFEGGGGGDEWENSDDFQNNACVMAVVCLCGGGLVSPCA